MDLTGAWRWLVYLGLVLAIAAGAWALQRRIHDAGMAQGRAEIQAQWDAANADALRQQQDAAARQKAAAQAQSEAFERAAAAWAASLKKAKHEVFVATENLAGCRLDPAAVRLLNDAAAGPRGAAGAD